MGVRASKLKKRREQIGLGETPAAAPLLPPKGYIPLSVGFHNNTRRYVVHTKALGDADFSEFLRKSAEEYGFCNQGILKIPYEAKDFEEWILGRNYMKIIRVIRVKPS
uniref:Uncharacterized protein MANES_04G149100 n=1 Tax=Rhizophora mucronata TaxID=61149 RepID=A0A2P2MX39_RHIMU